MTEDTYQILLTEIELTKNFKFTIPIVENKNKIKNKIYWVSHCWEQDNTYISENNESNNDINKNDDKQSLKKIKESIKKNSNLVLLTDQNGKILTSSLEVDPPQNIRVYPNQGYELFRSGLNNGHNTLHYNIWAYKSNEEWRDAAELIDSFKILTSDEKMDSIFDKITSALPIIGALKLSEIVTNTILKIGEGIFKSRKDEYIGAESGSLLGIEFSNQQSSYDLGGLKIYLNFRIISFSKRQRQFRMIMEDSNLENKKIDLSIPIELGKKKELELKIDKVIEELNINSLISDLSKQSGFETPHLKQ